MYIFLIKQMIYFKFIMKYLNGAAVYLDTLIYNKKLKTGVVIYDMQKIIPKQTGIKYR